MNVEILVSREYLDILRSKKWILVTGFPGFGYVGTIATKYLVSQLKANKIGNIITKYMPDFIALDDYGILSPYEIFMSDRYDILIVVNNAIPAPAERVAYVRSLVRWATSVGVKEFILVGGLNSKFKEGNEKLRWLKTSVSNRELKEPTFHKGLYVVGPLAILFLVLEIEGIPGLMILPYTEPEKYDPRAAAVFIEKLNELLNLHIDVQGLLEYSKAVEEAEELLSETLKHIKKAEDRGPKPYI